MDTPCLLDGLILTALAYGHGRPSRKRERLNLDKMGICEVAERQEKRTTFTSPRAMSKASRDLD